MKAVHGRRASAVPSVLTTALAVATFACVYAVESRRALRRRVEPRGRHTARNIAVAGIAAATVHLIEAPVVMPIARFVEARRWGLLGRVRLPVCVSVTLAAVLMDYTLYVWHVLVHRVPALWRLHLVHHVDLDLDVSTALRFHFGELLVSIPWRVAQIVAVGTTPRALTAWQTATLISVMFHHSNIALPRAVERRLAWFVVTPRMHGIHHSVVPSEVNSNWSSGLSLWDRLHRTLHPATVADDVVVGVPGYLSPAAVSLPRILALPFRPPALP